jgi:hypothetical protein
MKNEVKRKMLIALRKSRPRDHPDSKSQEEFLRRNCIRVDFRHRYSDELRERRDPNRKIAASPDLSTLASAALRARPFPSLLHL